MQRSALFPKESVITTGHQMWLEHPLLVGGLEHFLFFHILGIMIPIDFHIFQDG